MSTLFRLFTTLAFLFAALGQFGPSPAPASPYGESGPDDFVISEVSCLDCDELTPQVAFNSQANEYLVVWAHTNSVSSEIWAQRVDALTGSLIASTITVGLAEGNDLDVTYNPEDNQYLVVWVAETTPGGGEREVYGRRIDQQGNLLGDSATRYSQFGPVGDPNCYVTHPSVVYNTLATQYLVVWSQYCSPDWHASIYGQRVSTLGAELAGDFQISSGLHDMSPEAAYNNQTGEYLVLWIDKVIVSSVHGQRLSQAGNEVGADDFQISEIPPGSTSLSIYDLSAAYNQSDNQYLVVWDAGGDSLPSPSWEIYGQRLSSDGTLLDLNVRISDIQELHNNTDPEATNPAVVFNSLAGEYLVVWSGNYSDTNQKEIYGQRLHPTSQESGADDFRLSSMGPDGDSRFEGLDSAVTFNSLDASYLVVWEGDDDTPPLVDEMTEIFGQLYNYHSDLSLSGGATPSPVAPNASLTYNLTVTNEGPEAADDLSLFIQLPNSVTYDGYTSSFFSCSYTASDIICTAPTLANGASAIIAITVQAPASGDIQTYISISGMNYDPDATNSSLYITTPVSSGPRTIFRYLPMTMKR